MTLASRPSATYCRQNRLYQSALPKGVNDEAMQPAGRCDDFQDSQRICNATIAYARRFPARSWPWWLIDYAGGFNHFSAVSDCRGY